ncbi:MAG: antitoxin [Candidatus Omnitrophica bacterium]|nr:antitoxin [Candidatus Omnitrophota bacterium]
MKKDKFDKYEQDIIDSYENNELRSVKNVKHEIKKHRKYAQNTLKKDKRVNIRMSSKDLEGIQLKAIEEGLPYQTLLASIIHKFLNGKMIEKKNLTSRSRQL